ncbi:rod shape-determining protein MreC [Candidatus Berkelbacteria bacterium RBG_13_40_8]|uniref:Cell shape-determining protein MreC n=1 Tax=Candidatus Berkelbacteria bacterium RBG_13_40_8 TaxID=1797467 RepID=A0A1F5DLE9_9BACT|nr:MAG: rod shape-determining protein MreC [Candidatus Berkelbacteria bacterium RBG_13_40_8]
MRKWRFIIIILFVAILGFFLSPLGLSKATRNYFWEIAQPLGIATRASLGKIFPFLGDLLHFRKIIQQNANLVKENLDLQSKLGRLTEVDYENEVLKKELGFMKSQISNQTIPAAIIGQSSGYLKSLVIDKGKDSGLEQGDAVISQGFLVGTLTDVRKNNSELTLITDFNSLIPVVLQESRGTGLLRGGLSGLSVEDIPLNISIKKDENVITSGLGGHIPQGILIGKVSGVISKEGEIFQKATVSSPVDFSKLEVLFVIIKND